jgi:protein-S-isoprenylcysteine O-methyltransferase Ste14
MSINFGDFARNGGWWVVAQFALFALILLALARNTTPASALQAIGWAAIGAAVVLAGSGLWMIRNHLTALPAPRHGAVLLDQGPFSLVRHPIYGGVILGFLGLSIRGGNLLAALLTVVLVPFFWAKTEHEERLLAARLPEYDDYRTRVRRRFIPWIL